MCVQACWETDSPLKQISHLELEVSMPRGCIHFIELMVLQVVNRCKEAGVETVRYRGDGG